MDARALVFDVGDPVVGWGRLVRTADGDWFDPPLAVALGGGFRRQAPTPSRFAVPVEGAAFESLDHRRELDGAVEGQARVYGRWLGGRIRVERQTGERPEMPGPRWREPPCAPPPGGWPHGIPGSSPGNLDVDLGDLEETGAAVTVVYFRPGEDQAVLVIAATDIPAVEARLRPQLHDRLCVVESLRTRRQVDGAHEHLRSMWQRWGLYGTGRSCDERAQTVIGARLVRVTDEIATWVGTQPDGLVTLRPWLAPVGVSPTAG